MDDFQCKVAISSHTHHESGQRQLADEQIEEEATERKRALMCVFQHLKLPCRQLRRRFLGSICTPVLENWFTVSQV